MSRRGCCLPANASGFEPHRVSITRRLGQAVAELSSCMEARQAAEREAEAMRVRADRLASELAAAQDSGALAAQTHSEALTKVRERTDDGYDIHHDGDGDDIHHGGYAIHHGGYDIHHGGYDIHHGGYDIHHGGDTDGDGDEWRHASVDPMRARPDRPG
jgi:hypothetical protein